MDSRFLKVGYDKDPMEWGTTSGSFRKILRHQRNTTTNMAKCLEAITAGDGDTTVLQQLLTATQRDMEELSEVLSDCLDVKYYNEITTPSSPALTGKVFGVLKLAEMILEHLSGPDVFKAMKVNKSFKSAVYSSPKLQHKLFLRSKPTDHFKCLNVVELGVRGPVSSTRFQLFPPYDRYGNLEIEGDGDEKRNLFFYGNIGLPVARLGTRISQMHPCQPPVYSVSFRLECFEEGHYDERYQFANAEGVTLGDLIETARRIRVEHDHRNASAEHWVVIYLRASVELPVADLKLLEKETQRRRGR